MKKLFRKQSVKLFPFLLWGCLSFMGSFMYSCAENGLTDEEIAARRAEAEQTRRQGIDSLLQTASRLPETKESDFTRKTTVLSRAGTAYHQSKDNPYVLKPGFYYEVKRQVKVDGCIAAEQFRNDLSWDVIWPGNIVTIPSALANNAADLPALHPLRAPGTLTLAVINGQEGLSVPLEKFSKSEVIAQLNNLIRRNGEGSFHADLSYESYSVRSTSEMAFYLGLSKPEFDSKYGQSFQEVKWEGNTFKYMVLVKQIFFTILFDDPPRSAAGLFAPHVTADHLAAQLGKDVGTPLGYISSVSYGRSFLMLLEEEKRTFLTDEDMQRNVMQAHSDTPSHTDSLNQYTKAHIRQIGGKTLPFEIAVLNSPKEIIKFLKETAKFGPDNLGAPVAYRMKTLTDLKPVDVPHTIDDTYTFTDYEFVPDDNQITFYDMKIVCESMGERPLRGNYEYVDDSACYGIRSVKLEYAHSVDGKPIEFQLLTGHKQTERFGGEFKLPAKQLPALGVAPEGYIRLTLDAWAYGKRFSRSFPFKSYSNGEARDYTRTVTFRYNKVEQAWQTENDHFDNSKRWDTPFCYMGVNDDPDHCPARFRLFYRFKTNQKEYK